MKVIRHKVQDVPFQRARWVGGVIVPEIVILHDTAGRLETGNSAAYLAKNTAGVSVHFVVERDGSITQLVETNRRANHAGKSSFNGRTDCNGFSIGIEIVNPGRMTRIASVLAPLAGRAWWGEAFADDDSEFDLADITTPQHGSGVWMSYPQAQIDGLCRLLECLFRDIPSLSDITTHWYVSPGRKVDTNPLFPLDHVKAKILGRDDPADTAADEGASAVQPGSFVQVHSPASPLNLRRWPSFNPNVIAAIPHGATLPVFAQREIDGTQWLKVLFDGREGWVVGRYTAKMP